MSQRERERETEREREREREREEAEMEAWSWAGGGCHGEREAAEMGNGQMGNVNLVFIPRVCKGSLVNLN